ncbi:unnamed protein product, partial [Phaeothamnion confervicola]
VRGEWLLLWGALKRLCASGRTLLLTDGACRLHAVPRTRLENPKRLDEAGRALAFVGQSFPLETHVKTAVDPFFVERVEEQQRARAAAAVAATYVGRLRQRIDGAGTDWECLTADSDDEEGTGFEPLRDTVGNKRSWRAAAAATGAVLEAVDRVLSGRALNAFCAVRPPGHHAGVHLHCVGAVSNGFCLLNNVAVGALYARHQRGAARDVLCRTLDPGFLYCSMHAYGESSDGGPTVFPGTGGEDDAPHAHVLNLPLGPQV